MNDCFTSFVVALFGLLTFSAVLTSGFYDYNVDTIFSSELEPLIEKVADVPDLTCGYSPYHISPAYREYNTVVPPSPPDMILLSTIAASDTNCFSRAIPFIFQIDVEKFGMCFLHSVDELEEDETPGDNEEDNDKDCRTSKVKERSFHRLVSNDYSPGVTGIVELSNMKKFKSFNRYCETVMSDKMRHVPFVTLLFNFVSILDENENVVSERDFEYIYGLKSILPFYSVEMLEMIMLDFFEASPDIDIDNILRLQSESSLFYLLGVNNMSDVEKHNFITDLIVKYNPRFTLFLDAQVACNDESTFYESLSAASSYYGPGIIIVALNDLSVGIDEYTRNLLDPILLKSWNELTASEYFNILLTFFEDILVDNEKWFLSFSSSNNMVSRELDVDSIIDFVGKNFVRLISGTVSLEEKESVANRLLKIPRLQIDIKYSVASSLFKYYENSTSLPVVDVKVIDEIVNVMGRNGLRGTFLNYGNKEDRCDNGVENGCIGILDNANEILCDELDNSGSIMDTIFINLMITRNIKFCHHNVDVIGGIFDIRNRQHYEALMNLDLQLLRALVKKLYRSGYSDMKYLAANYVHRHIDSELLERKNPRNFLVNGNLMLFYNSLQKAYSLEELGKSVHNSLLDKHIEDILAELLSSISTDIHALGSILGVSVIIDNKVNCSNDCWNTMLMLRQGRLLETPFGREYRAKLIRNVAESKLQLHVPSDYGVLRYLYRYWGDFGAYTTVTDNLNDFIRIYGKIFLWRTLMNPGCEECIEFCAPYCDSNTKFLGYVWENEKKVLDFLCADKYTASLIDTLTSFDVDDTHSIVYPWSCEKDKLGKSEFNIFNYDAYLSLKNLDDASFKHIVRTLFDSEKLSEEHLRKSLELVAQYLLDYPEYPKYTDVTVKMEEELYDFQIASLASNSEMDDTTWSRQDFTLTLEEKKGLIVLFPAFVEEYPEDVTLDTYASIDSHETSHYPGDTNLFADYTKLSFSERVQIVDKMPVRMIEKMISLHCLGSIELSLLKVTLRGEDFGKSHLKAFVNVSTEGILFDTIFSGMDPVGLECINGKNSCFKDNRKFSAYFENRFKSQPKLVEGLLIALENMESIYAGDVENAVGQNTWLPRLNAHLQLLRYTKVQLRFIRLLAHTLIDDLDDEFDFSGFKQYIRFSQPSLEVELNRFKPNGNSLASMNYWRLIKARNTAKECIFCRYEVDLSKALNKGVCRSMLEYVDPILGFNIFQAMSLHKVFEHLIHSPDLKNHLMDLVMSKLSNASLMTILYNYIKENPKFMHVFLSNHISDEIFLPLRKSLDTKSVRNPSFKAVPYIMNFSSHDNGSSFQACVNTGDNLNYSLKIWYLLFESERTDFQSIQASSVLINFEDNLNLTKIEQEVLLTVPMATVPTVFVTVELFEYLECNMSNIVVLVGSIKNDKFTLYIERDLEGQDCSKVIVHYLALAETDENSKSLWSLTKEREFTVKFSFEFSTFFGIARKLKPKITKEVALAWLNLYNYEYICVDIEVSDISTNDEKLYINGNFWTKENCGDVGSFQRLLGIKSILINMLSEHGRCPHTSDFISVLPNGLTLRDDQYFFAPIRSNDKQIDVPCDMMIAMIREYRFGKGFFELEPFILYQLPGNIQEIVELSGIQLFRDSPRLFTPMKLRITAKCPPPKIISLQYGEKTHREILEYAAGCEPS